MPDYQNGKIYKIECTLPDVEGCYVGSTCKKYLCDRMTGHRSDAKNEKKKQSRIYQTMREHGIPNFKIVLIEEFPCNSKDELRAREEHWIKELKAEWNMMKAIIAMDKASYKHDHYEKNIDAYKARGRSHYEKNKELYKARRDQNRDKINEKARDYYQRKNSEKIFNSL